MHIRLDSRKYRICQGGLGIDLSFAAKGKDSPMIRFRCPKCGKEMQTPSNMQGQRVTCPGCQTILAIPVLRAPVKAAPAKSEEIVECTAASPSSQGSSAKKVLVVAAAAVFRTILMSYPRNRVPSEAWTTPVFSAASSTFSLSAIKALSFVAADGPCLPDNGLRQGHDKALAVVGNQYPNISRLKLACMDMDVLW